MEQRGHERFNKDVYIMTTKIQKWGNSLAIRIPKNIADQLHIDQNSEVEFYIENQVLTITLKKKKASLEELLSQVTDENRHKAVPF